ncbi:SDR family oxidoreductase [Conexibacter sp. SYSU D00693]|uniref:SDR family oxidoreductase n=1 Tax=Conexibacter sp. SYSU D00693 TaxID=2812560 RepID=UPI00196B1550|nr:SDR family oxidoreductase [Conexibacter sp. SYSU D00693]
MDLGITGRVALVTGASKGIGRAIAAQLVAEGARVAVSSRDAARAAATAEAIGAAMSMAWDTDDVDGAAGLVDGVQQGLGAPVDVLVCNTGGPPAGPDPLGFSRADWEAAYRSLVLAPMALAQRCVPGMRERGWGRVLNVASTSVREPLPALTLSNVHRAGTLAGWKTLARAVAGDGVTVNTVLPGRIATDRMAAMHGSLDAAQELAREQVPAGRLGTVEELAAAAAFLCSDRAGYVTGQALAVDGGLLQSI